MENTKGKTVIISAFKNTLDLVNYANAFSLSLDLRNRDIIFTPVDSIYNNIKSVDFYCYVPDKKLLDILELASNYNQDCVLHLDENKKASLIHLEPACEEYIGELIKVSRDVAEDLGEYIEYCNDYYIVA